MIIDTQNRFSNAQSITTGSDSGSTPGVRSTNIIDLGPGAERRIGTGRTLHVVVLVTTTLASSGSNDYMEVSLYSDSDPAWGSPIYRQQLVRLPAVSPAGTLLIGTIRPGMLTEQYIGLYYLSQADVFSGAGITAFLVDQDGIDAWTTYACNYTIS